MKSPALWLCSAALATAGPPELPDPPDAAYPAIERFVNVLESVRDQHPDTDLLAYDRLVNHALEGMLAGLDPHSSFIHPEMAALLKKHPQIDPHLASLGMSFAIRNDGPYVSAVSPDGPAAEAGILPGSTLIEINDNPVGSTPLVEWLPAMKRPAGAITTLQLKSPASPQPETYSLTHRYVANRSVTEVRLLDGKTGYLRLASFGPACAAEVEAALDELEDDGMTALVLDLRENGGGDLGETVKILGLFLPPGTKVVETRGRERSDSLITPERQRRNRSYPIAVLIDRMSASASELTAGALQDLKRATVVGETSYGKGSVQHIVPSGGGTALRLTVATYHTPSGNTPHRKGITPDQPVTIDEQTRTNYQHRFRKETLTAEERKKLKSWNDPVLAKAIESLDPKTDSE